MSVLADSVKLISHLRLQTRHLIHFFKIVSALIEAVSDSLLTFLSKRENPDTEPRIGTYTFTEFQREVRILMYLKLLIIHQSFRWLSMLSRR